MANTKSDNKSMDAQYEKPSGKVLEQAGELNVLDAQGNKISFKDIYSGDKNPALRQLVIFVRHFFCGHCQEYVRALQKDLPQSRLSSLDPPVHLTLIGCGEPSLIAKYASDTSSDFTMYCDPQRKIYEKLNMVSNIGMGNKAPEYIKSSLLSQVVGSITNGLSTGARMFSGGNFSQDGGEWLFEDGDLKWCHKMSNTRDHAEISELEELLGIKVENA